MVIAVLLGGLPFFIVYQSWASYHLLDDEEFEKKFGAPYEGLKKDNRAGLLYNTFFVLRRFSLAIICLYFNHNVFLQISISMYITLASACYLVTALPFEQSLAQKLEVYNECCTDLLFSLLYCFTNLVPIHIHKIVAYFFMAVIIANICAHLFFLVKDSIVKLIQWCKGLKKGGKCCGDECVIKIGKKKYRFGSKIKYTGCDGIVKDELRDVMVKRNTIKAQNIVQNVQIEEFKVEARSQELSVI